VDNANYENEIDLELALQKAEGGESINQTIVVPKQPPRLFRRGSSDISETTYEDDEVIDLVTMLCQSKAANIMVEAINSNPRKDGEPVISIIKEALKGGMHVVSANKTPLAHCDDINFQEVYWELQELAAQNSVKYLHESAGKFIVCLYLIVFVTACTNICYYHLFPHPVMDGVPIFSLWKYTMPHAKLTSIRGCLNSTTTMIITRMEGNLEGVGGSSFQVALDICKEMGIVEADESLDIDGYDAAVKLRALLVVLSSSDEANRVILPTMDEIPKESIRSLKREDIKEAYANGKKKYRLVATANLIEEESNSNDTPTKRWEAAVRLQLIEPSDPLYNLTGADASVQLSTDVLGPVTVVSTNPTLKDTAYGLFSDIIRVAAEAK